MKTLKLDYCFEEIVLNLSFRYHLKKTDPGKSKAVMVRSRLMNKFLHERTAFSREAFNKLKNHHLKLVKERKIEYFSNLNVKNIMKNSIL